MSVFVDTSALYAVLDRDDDSHGRARETWRELLDGDRALTTSNYVLVESFALVQSRLGIDAARVLHDDVVPALVIEWVTPDDHRAAAQAVLAAGRRRLSLVDCTSFGVMQRLGLRSAFAFDKHFDERGFAVMPS